MLAKDSYEKWTSAFSPTSTYEGTWTKGQQIRFVSTAEDGTKGGMISEIAEIEANHFVSIRHLGTIMGDQMIFEGPEVESWANSLENYTFEDTDSGATKLTVTLDSLEDYQSYFDENYPIALDLLKALCEKEN
jgi:hypothetical protein